MSDFVSSQPDAALPKTEYYAAANTCRGFVSFFGEIFDPLPTLYIIKGGPGTGKSSFMREVGNAAEKRGLSVEYYYCSSDPVSLDGVIIRESGVGIIDGTAPHTRDPKYPGATDSILNFGDFWDEEKLKKNRERVHLLIDRKSVLWQSAYDYLRAADCADSIAKKLLEGCILGEKLDAAAQRAVKNLRRGDGFCCSTRMTDAICGGGNVYLPTFEAGAGTKWVIRDEYGCGYLFLRAVLDSAKAKRLPVEVSRAPLNPDYESGVSILGADTAFVIEREGGEYGETARVINMRRFVDGDRFASVKSRVRAAKKLRDEAVCGADGILREIRSLHSELESIYVSAMNFRRKESFTRDFIKNLLG